MNKKLIALAVAAALAPAAALADSGNVVIYGQANASYDNISTNSDGQDTLNRISSNSSRLGFKGTEDLGNGLSAVWQMESSIGLDATAGSTLGGRNTFVGLSSKTMGTALLGRHDTPYKLATGSLDVFADTMGDYNSIIGAVNGVAVRDLRLDNVAAYISPTFSGFHAAVATSMLNEAGNNNLSNPKAWSLAGIYNNGPMFGSLAYEKQDAANVAATAASVQCLDTATGAITTQATAAACTGLGATFAVTSATAAVAAADAYSTKGLKLGLGYTFGATKVGLVVERLKDSRSDSELTRNAWLLNVAHTMGANVIKAAYGKANDGKDGTSDTGAKNITIGLDHNLSKRTAVYALYTKTDNDTDATYNIGGNGAGGAYTPAAGKDPRAISLGMKHSF